MATLECDYLKSCESETSTLPTDDQEHDALMRQSIYQKSLKN